jgi:hypothetical protein
MTETENLEVEHNASYELTPEQFRKLVAEKFRRNGIVLEELNERESQVTLD